MATDWNYVHEQISNVQKIHAQAIEKFLEKHIKMHRLIPRWVYQKIYRIEIMPNYGCSIITIYRFGKKIDSIKIEYKISIQYER